MLVIVIDWNINGLLKENYYLIINNYQLEMKLFIAFIYYYIFNSSLHKKLLNIYLHIFDEIRWTQRHNWLLKNIIRHLSACKCENSWYTDRRESGTKIFLILLVHLNHNLYYNFVYPYNNLHIIRLHSRLRRRLSLQCLRLNCSNI